MEKSKKVENGQKNVQKKHATVYGRTKYGVSKDEINVKTALQKVQEDVSERKKKFNKNQNFTRKHLSCSNDEGNDV